MRIRRGQGQRGNGSQGKGVRRWPDLEVPASASSKRYRRNGKLRFSWLDCNELGSIQSSLSVFVDVYRHHAVVFARYCEEGRCSASQLRLIEALYIEGMSLREFADLQGVSPQAISARIDALANKAPEFYRWWRNINASHQRPSKRPPSQDEV